MGRIYVLDQHIAELIAAGEVVERPSAVIKELVENSIDAHAKRIAVEIKNGGKTYMRVTDDGHGILKEDIKKAFLRHATSKVKTSEDLNSIFTLGFRGEALASIAAVSKINLISKTAEVELGFCYQIAGGKEIYFDEIGCSVGTSVLVEDLFYNVPARLKFLKKDSAETSAIAGLLDRIALSHPEISFCFTKDGKQTLLTPGDGKLQSCIYVIYGKEAVSSMIPVDYKSSEISIGGFVSQPVYSRPNRNMQHFFINGRYIKNLIIMSAVESAFHGSLMIKKFPACVLHIKIPYDWVDVNIHPAKTEVKFVDDKTIFRAVYSAIKEALTAHDSYKNVNIKPTHLKGPESLNRSYAKSIISPAVSRETEKFKKKSNIPENKETALFSPKEDKESVSSKNIVAPKVNTPPHFKDSQDFATANRVSKAQNENDSIPEILIPNIFSYKNNLKINAKFKGQSDQPKQAHTKDLPTDNLLNLNLQKVIIPAPQVLENDMNIIGEIFATYILLEHRQTELILIDKHAAHERILYEKLKQSSNQENSQLLLAPLLITLEKEEYGKLLENLSLLSKAGFFLEDFGSGTLLVRAIPLFLDANEVKDTIIEIASKLSETFGDINIDKLDWLYHNIACRAAIRAGDKTKNEEILSLVKELQRAPGLKYCPHGRPIFVSLSKHEIEKQFGRM